MATSSCLLTLRFLFQLLVSDTLSAFQLGFAQNAADACNNYPSLRHPNSDYVRQIIR